MPTMHRAGAIKMFARITITMHPRNIRTDKPTHTHTQPCCKCIQFDGVSYVFINILYGFGLRIPSTFMFHSWIDFSSAAF